MVYRTKCTIPTAANDQVREECLSKVTSRDDSRPDKRNSKAETSDPLGGNGDPANLPGIMVRFLGRPETTLEILARFLNRSPQSLESSTAWVPVSGNTVIMPRWGLTTKALDFGRLRPLTDDEWKRFGHRY